LVIFGLKENKEGIMKSLVLGLICITSILALSLAAFAQGSCDHDHSDAKAAAAEGDTETAEKAVEKAAEKKAKKENPMVVLKTNHGDITIELFQKHAPISVDNFLTYVKDGFYDETIFHRVVNGFVLQAGGMAEIDGKMKQKEQRDPIKNEATNGLSNKKGTLSMARTSAINSGTSHFFVNLVDNTRLDHKGTAPSMYGYAVFGEVTKGMDVVEKIAKVAVTDKGQFKNVPVKPVVIEKAMIVGMEKEAKKVEKKAEESVEEKAAEVKEMKKEAKKAKEE
jgi:peptidyl-prolyl cis-trans isomerase B (cyclophilin B)